MTSNRTFRVIIIGGGASGLMTAALLPQNTALVIEGNRHIGAKIAISGGGKCNITNKVLDASFYEGDEAFIEAVLQRFDNEALLQWLQKRGLTPVMRDSGQYFCPQNAAEAVRLLRSAALKQRFLLETKVFGVLKEGNYFKVKTSRGAFYANKVVIASGGLSYPKLGASGIGYTIAEHIGHRIIPTAPALVGFTVQKEQFFFKTLSGISLGVNVNVGQKRLKGSLLFAHKGISGPVILDTSLYWRKGSITVDFLPRFEWHTINSISQFVSTALPIPKRAATAFLKHLGIEDKPVKALSRTEKERIDTLRAYTFAPAGTFGYKRAEVTKGGVATDDVCKETMMSKLCEGLYFVGEVLDVTGRLGGYNFQWAFSSAYVAAQSIGGEVG
jgi:predicted Rossmann fold flavoprotein